jgi:hypothetical protein
MKRILRTTDKVDAGRRERRKQSFKRNKRKQHRTPKKRIPKVVYGSKEFYDQQQNRQNGQNGQLNPYYDPQELHVHQWYYGKIPCAEDHKSQFFVHQKLRKEYNGSYCKICHKTRPTELYIQKDVIKYRTKTRDLDEAMKKYIMEEERENRKRSFNEIDLEVEMSSLGLSEKFDIRDIEEDEELFIDGCFCKFLIGSQSKSGKILREIPRLVDCNDRFLEIEDDNGDKHVVSTFFVFPEYMTENQNLVPVSTPPRRIKKATKKGPSDLYEEWGQKWRFYKEWRKFQFYLKQYLPTAVEMRQRFDDSELYNHEEQQNLLKHYVWSKNPKKSYGELTKKLNENRPSFFMPAEFIPDTYFKVLNDNEYDRYNSCKRTKLPNLESRVILC